jgi:hypothetical protein
MRRTAQRLARDAQAVYFTCRNRGKVPGAPPADGTPLQDGLKTQAIGRRPVAIPLVLEQKLQLARLDRFVGRRD